MKQPGILPIVLSESDPEGYAACSAFFELADARKTNIAGLLTWAFEFEDQPYFDGFGTPATNGIDKPVLNIFRMAALMSGDRCEPQQRIYGLACDGVPAESNRRAVFQVGGGRQVGRNARQSNPQSKIRNGGV